jgi:hypothetical protein
MNKNDKGKFLAAIQTARSLHFIDFVIWDVFKSYKSKKFMECIKNGMHWEAAFQTAKKVKR